MLTIASRANVLSVLDRHGSEVRFLTAASDKLEPRLSFTVDDAPATNISAASFSPDGGTLYTGHSNGALRAWDVTGEAVKEKTSVQPGGSDSGRLTLSSDGRTLTSTSADRKLCLWDLGQSTPEQISMKGPLATSWDALNLGAFSSDGRMLVTAYPGVIWRFEGGHSQAVADAKTPPIYSAAFSVEGNLLAAGSWEADPKSLTVWDLSGNRPRKQAVWDAGLSHFLGFAPGGKVLVNGPLGEAGDVRVWDIGGPKPTQRMAIPTAQAYSAALAPNGKTIAIAIISQEVVFWGIADAKPESRGKLTDIGTRASVAYSSDGKTLASGNLNGQLILWDVTEEQQDEWHKGADGVAYKKTVLKVRGKKLREWRYPGPIHGVAFAGNRHLLTLNGNGTIYVLRLAPAPDPDRKAAEWVLSIGGKVRVNGLTGPLIVTVKDLPAGPFQVFGVCLDHNSKVTPAGLASLKGLSNLAHLDLYETLVTDAGLAHLKELTSLGFLGLRGSRVTDAGLVNLKGLSNLTYLDLDGNSVTNTGLTHLKGLTNLVTEK